MQPSSIPAALRRLLEPISSHPSNTFHWNAYLPPRHIKKAIVSLLMVNFWISKSHEVFIKSTLAAQYGVSDERSSGWRFNPGPLTIRKPRTLADASDSPDVRKNRVLCRVLGFGVARECGVSFQSAVLGKHTDPECVPHRNSCTGPGSWWRRGGPGRRHRSSVGGFPSLKRQQVDICDPTCDAGTATIMLSHNIYFHPLWSKHPGGWSAWMATVISLTVYNGVRNAVWLRS